MKKREKILQSISSVSRQLFGNGGGRVFLYGSQVRNEATPLSDWDLLIITDDSLQTPDVFERFAFPFAEIGWLFDAQITPLLFSQSEWDAQRGTMFYHNVLSDAIRL